MLLMTEDLEKEINVQYNKLSSYTNILDKDNLKNIHFMPVTNNSVEGIYLYSDKQGYHYTINERGKITRDNTTHYLFELSYWLFRYLTHLIAFDYEYNHRRSGVDTRRMAFSKQLELLDLVNPNFKKMMEVEIDEILKENPYNDELFK